MFNLFSWVILVCISAWVESGFVVREFLLSNRMCRFWEERKAVVVVSVMWVLMIMMLY